MGHRRAPEQRDGGSRGGTAITALPLSQSSTWDIPGTSPRVETGVFVFLLTGVFLTLTKHLISVTWSYLYQVLKHVLNTSHWQQPIPRSYYPVAPPPSYYILIKQRENIISNQITSQNETIQVTKPDSFELRLRFLFRTLFRQHILLKAGQSNNHKYFRTNLYPKSPQLSLLYSFPG